LCVINYASSNILRKYVCPFQLHRIDRFKSLAFVANFLAKREHLLEKASLFLAKAFVVFKVRISVACLLCESASVASGIKRIRPLEPDSF
jgi:hypothetical protein